MGKNTEFGVLLFIYLMIVGVFTAWFTFTGGINEPVRQMFYFVRESKIEPQSLSFDAVAGFVLLNLLLSILVIAIIRVITGKSPKMFFEKWEAVLNLPVHMLFYKLTAIVAAEEIFFRWLPLAVLWPLAGGTHVGLWFFVITSSFVFGMLHITNQEPGDDRGFVHTSPQIIGGVVLSYTFLAFGFLGAVLIHLSFDMLLVAFAWMFYRYDPNP